MVKLTSSNMECLLLDTLNYFDLWQEVERQGLVVEDEEEGGGLVVSDGKQLKELLKAQGVKFSSEVDPESDDMSYYYYATLPEGIEKFIVYRCAQTLRIPIFSGSKQECEAFGDSYNWELEDENTFVWSLEMEEE